MKTNTGSRGMSLLEVVMVSALLAILLGFAIPGYQQYLLRSHRVAVIERLLDAARCQERIYTTAFHYDTTRCGGPVPSEHYRLRFEPADTVGSLGFTVYADPLGAQQGDPCGSLGLDHSGRRTISGDAARQRRCWEGR
jgi:type IV pilus assembly protein PilE